LEGIGPEITTIRDARGSGDCANLWKVAGLKRDEVRISSVLAWFLRHRGTHGQGDKLLVALVQRIFGSSGCGNNRQPEPA